MLGQRPQFTMRPLFKHRRAKLLLAALAAVGIIVGWLYLNRPNRADMAAYAPADSLAYVEAGSLTELAEGVEGTTAWKSLAGLIGARSNLVPGQWWIRIARWTGIGSAETIVIARSQVAIVFTGAEVSEVGPSLNVKPLAALVIETHTSQRRMRPVLEQQIEAFARRIYAQPQLINGTVDLMQNH